MSILFNQVDKLERDPYEGVSARISRGYEDQSSLQCALRDSSFPPQTSKELNGVLDTCIERGSSDSKIRKIAMQGLATSFVLAQVLEGWQAPVWLFAPDLLWLCIHGVLWGPGKEPSKAWIEPATRARRTPVVEPRVQGMELVSFDERRKRMEERRYFNCFATARRYTLANEGLRYVEGLATKADCNPNEAFWHAWCVDPSGGVFDPTWPPGSGTEYLGHAFDDDALAHISPDGDDFGLIPRIVGTASDEVVTGAIALQQYQVLLAWVPLLSEIATRLRDQPTAAALPSDRALARRRAEDAAWKTVNVCPDPLKAEMVLKAIQTREWERFYPFGVMNFETIEKSRGRSINREAFWTTYYATLWSAWRCRAEYEPPAATHHENCTENHTEDRPERTKTDASSSALNTP